MQSRFYPWHSRSKQPGYRRPQRAGPLVLLAGPERIESGWWDGGDARRDYFIAVDSGRRWLWIFRDPRSPGGWFLHGWFA